MTCPLPACVCACVCACLPVLVCVPVCVCLQVTPNEIYLVVNAGCRDKDLAHIGAHLKAAQVSEAHTAAVCGRQLEGGGEDTGQIKEWGEGRQSSADPALPSTVRMGAAQD